MRLGEIKYYELALKNMNAEPLSTFAVTEWTTRPMSKEEVEKKKKELSEKFSQQGWR
jgi:hypothetical protein